MRSLVVALLLCAVAGFSQTQEKKRGGVPASPDQPGAANPGPIPQATPPVATPDPKAKHKRTTKRAHKRQQQSESK